LCVCIVDPVLKSAVWYLPGYIRIINKSVKWVLSPLALSVLRLHGIRKGKIHGNFKMEIMK
jgi:hypothetical protein